ncbi:hypothetical protein [Streptomyces sp. NPDC001833]
MKTAIADGFGIPPHHHRDTTPDLTLRDGHGRVRPPGRAAAAPTRATGD